MASTENGAEGSPYSSDDSGAETTVPLAIGNSDPSVAAVIGCCIVMLFWILSFRQYLFRTGTNDGSKGRAHMLDDPDNPVRWKETRITFDCFRLLGSLLAAEVMFPSPPSDSGVSLFSLTAMNIASSVVYFLLIRRKELKQLKHYAAFNFATVGFSYGLTLQLLIISHQYNPGNVLTNTLILLHLLVFCMFTWNAVRDVMQKLELDQSERTAATSVVYSMYGLTMVNTIYYLWSTSLPYILCMEHFVPRTLAHVITPLWLLLACSQIITHWNTFYKEDSKSAVLHLTSDATHNCGIFCSGLLLTWYCDGRRAPTDIITYWKPLWPLLLADILGIIGYSMVCNQFGSARKVAKAMVRKVSEDKITHGATIAVMKTVAVQVSDEDVDGTDRTPTKLLGAEATDKVSDGTSMPYTNPMGVDAADDVIDGADTSVAKSMEEKVTGGAVGETATFLENPSDEETIDEEDEVGEDDESLSDENWMSGSYEILVTTNAERSVPVCTIILPSIPRMKITSASLNPEGHIEKLKLKETELLVSDIIKISPLGLTFSDPVRLKIPTSLPKYDEKWQYIVVASSDGGTTWKEMETKSQEEDGQISATVETTHLGQFAVKAKLIKHTHCTEKGKETKLKSSEETGVEVSLPSDSVSKDEEFLFARIITCEYWLACRKFKNTLGIEDRHFSPEGDMCYCYRCHNERGDRDSYIRGDPPQTYEIPQGWSRFGVSVNPAFMDDDLPVFNNWHRAFHGTNPDTVKKILQSSSKLLIPVDTMLRGHKLGEPSHFSPDRKPEGFDTRQVFVSPSIKYAGCDVYAAPQRYRDEKGKEYNVRVALQLCVRPGSYTVEPETVGATREGRTMDPLFSNDELEWFTEEWGGHALYGLLVKMDPK